MINLFVIFFCLLPWGNFLFKSLDCWHATGHFIQVSVLILFCYSFFEKAKSVQTLNKALGAFVCWAGLVTSYCWVKVFAQSKHYPIKIFMPYFNIICAILLYKLITEYLDKEAIEKILRWFKYSVIILLLYCVLQYLRLDEFLKGYSGHDELAGTIGNPMHLAGLLALGQPLFFKKTRENILSLLLLWLIILITGSATGFGTGAAVILFYLFFKNRLWFILSLALSLISTITLYSFKPAFFFNSDRFRVWGLAWAALKDKFITGFGLGAYGLSKIGDTNVHWQHLHNEYLQLVFELGAIGLVLVIWCVRDYFSLFRKINTDLAIRLASIFFGFCLLSAVTFTAHLWVISIIAVFSYAGMYCLKEERCCAPV